MNLKDLALPFSPADISWRVGATTQDKGKGIALAYLNARDVMARFDAVCGPENWQVEYPFSGCAKIGIKVPRQHDGEKFITWEWVWKSNGAGETDFEGVKGQYSDAFKRAAVLWGVGQYLYDLPNKWYPIIKKGKSYDFPDEVKKQLQKELNDWQKVQVPKSERMEFAKQARELMQSGDEHGLKEIFSEYNADQQVQLWPEFDSAERSSIKKLMEN
jgi:hypothetical protein